MKTAIVELVRRLDGLSPKTAIILGSGLGGFVDQLDVKLRIPFSDLDGFPQSMVSGHAAEIIVGELDGDLIMVLSGRVHYYEQGRSDAMRVPVEVMQGIGIEQLILTNSAGSVRDDMPPGSVMLINDHIAWSGMNPLIGEPSDKRFVGLTAAYDLELQELAKKCAVDSDVALKEGVYMWFSGPSFETPAEINAARILGADAVGMSTVPEVILARFCGLKVAAFSVVTNFAAGMTGAELTHDETKEMAPKGGAKLALVLGGMIRQLGKVT